MRIASLALLSCLLMVGCTSPSPPKKPSPYRYAQTAPTLPLGAYRKELL